MRFKPKTEDELKKVWEKGEYDFSIRAASDEKPTKNGGDMLTVQVEIHHPQRPSILITDYLGDFMPGKFRNFMYSIGLADQYEAGELEAEWCVRRDGRLKLGIEVDKDGQYPDKNKVIDYIATNGHSPAPQPQRQTSTHPANSATPDAQKKIAWVSFRQKFNLGNNAAGVAVLEEKVKAFFNKPTSVLSEREWKEFTDAGFVRTAPAAPFVEDQFKEDDIPF